MINRVLTLQTETITPDEGPSYTQPVVTIADSVTPQTDGWYEAYGPEAEAPPNALNATARPTIAYLYEDEQIDATHSRFVVFAEKAVLDQIGAGPSLDKYTGDWSHYRIDGDEPDTDPEAEPGARVSVSRVVKLVQKPPSDVSESKPYTVGNVQATSVKRSISSSAGPVNLKALAEK